MMRTVAYAAAANLSRRRLALLSLGNAAGPVAAGLLVFMAAVLLSRRALDALVGPLAFGTAAGCATACGLLAAIAYLVAGPRHLLRYTVFAALIAVAVALSLPRSSAPVVALVWLPATICGLREALGRGRTSARTPNLLRRWARFSKALRVEGRVIAQTTRFVDADGCDTLTALLTAQLAAGQRIASIHLAFSPPFAELPEAEAAPAQEDSAGRAEVQLKVASLLPYGCRIEVRAVSTAAEQRAMRVRLVVKQPRNRPATCRPTHSE